MTNALLFSNSSNPGGGFLEHAESVVSEYFDGITEVLFAPWALADHVGYTAQIAEGFARYGIAVRGLHEWRDPASAIRDGSALYVGGGSTFRLTKILHEANLIDPIRAAVAGGLRYSGASAGSLIASPTMRTTNDMPIVEPPSLDTLGLIPFQLNCHYVDADPSSIYAGQNRELRLAEFLEDNDVPVLGLRDGCWLRVDDATGVQRAVVEGTAVSPSAPGPGIVFRRGELPVEVSGDLSFLLEGTPRFDTA